MRVGIVGAGNIGGNCARQAVRAGHEVILSFSRDPKNLDQLAAQLGRGTRPASPEEAARSSDVVILSVPWGVIPEALEQLGSLEGKIVVDTTNQFGGGPKPAPGQTAASFNAARMPGARYVKSFNTLTAGFQEEAALRTGADRVVQWVCGDDHDSKKVVFELIESMGYVPVDLGGTETCQVMEAPRRDGAVYGEEYRAADAQAVVDAVQKGIDIPATPVYE